MHHSSVSWEITLLYFFSWNCTWLGQKEHNKVQNFRLSNAHMKFHQIYTLIGSICWKYIKFQLKRYRGIMSHDTKQWCKIWRKTDLLFQKWHEFGEFWPQHSKVSKGCTLICSYCEKYIMFDLQKSIEDLSFMTLKNDAKFDEKLTCSLENDIRNLANFLKSTWKSQNWDFHGILLSKVENAWAKNLHRSYVYKEW